MVMASGNETQARCWEFKDEPACVAKSDCFWNPRALGDDGDAHCKRKTRRVLQACPKCRRKN